MIKRILVTLLFLGLVVLTLCLLKIKGIWDPFTAPRAWHVNELPLHSLDTFPVTLQSRWGDTMRATGGTLVLPEVRGDTTSNHIQIAFGVLRAYAPSARAPVILLSGGPGSSGIEWGRGGYFYLVRALRHHSDVILLDQRGTGRSIPNLACDNSLSLPVDIESDAEEILVQSILSSAGDCLAAFRDHGLDLAGYNSVENAADIEDLRRALQYERLTLYGYSYGCQLAQVYLDRYPHRVERIILAGPVAPDLALKSPAGVHSQFVAIDSLARLDKRLSRYVPDFLGLMREVHSQLAEAPQDVSVPTTDALDEGDPAVLRTLFRVIAFFKPRVKMTMTDFHLQLMTQNDVGNDFWVGNFPAYYYQMGQGNWRDVGNRLRNFRRQPMVHGLLITTNCATSYTEARQRAALREEQFTVLSHASTSFGRGVAGCLEMGIQPLGDVFLEPVRSSVPALIIGGSLDGRTPLKNLDTIAARFPNSRTVTVWNAAHGNLMDNRIRDKVITFITDRDTGNLEIHREVVFMPPVPFKYNLGDTLSATMRSEGIEKGVELYHNLRAAWDGADDYYYDFSEANLNALGYRLLRAGRADEAVAIFQLVVQEYPEAWNAYDSLGEGLLVVGDTALAINMYETSLSLNFMNGNAHRAIRQVRESQH